MTPAAPANLYDDAELYDLQYDGYRDDLPFYRRLAEDHGGPVVELGAGSGRVTVTLARAAAPVIAVEPNAAMRARGEARVAAAGLGDLVRFVDADARSLDLGAKAALVVAPFNTLMHFESLHDQDEVLRRVRAHLLPGGAFACDLFVPRFGPLGVVRSEPPSSPARLGPRDLFFWQEHDPVRQLVVTHLRLDETDAEGRLHRRRAVLRQRYWARFELERALRGAGFADVRVHGDFDRSPFTEASAVMAAVART